MNFFLTCGRGTEEFAAEECRRLFEHCKVTFRDGKVFLGIEFVDKENEMIDKLVRLKTVERLFVSMKHAPDFQLRSFGQAKTQLKSLIQSITSWQHHFELCMKLKSAVNSNSSWLAINETITNRAPDIGVKQEAHAVVSSSSSEEQKSVYEQNHLSLPCGNLMSDSDNAKTYEQTRDHSDLSRNFLYNERKRQNMDSVVTFRVSAKCSGPACRYFSSQSLSQFLGPEIARATGWMPDLRRPQCEIYVQLNHEGCVIGLPVNSNPLSNRPYIRHAGLRTTIASIMVTLANIEPGYCVLDPMCGEATILVEASKAKLEHNGVVCIGCDIDAEQCRRASENVTFAGETGSVQILRADVTNLPFPDCAVDAVICDVPFGNKHSTVESVRRLMGPLVSSLNRVVKKGCKVVLLVGAETKNHLLEVVKNMRHCDVLSDSSSEPEASSSTSDGLNAADSRLASQLHGDGRLFASGLRLKRLEEQISDARSRVGRIASGLDVYVSRLPLPRENVTYLVKCEHGVRDLRCGGVSLQCVSDLLICDGRPDCFNGFDESPQLCDENPFELGDQFLGWVHWQRCLLRPDHQARLTVISVRRSNIFRARWHIGFAVTVFSTNSSSEILHTLQCNGVYNPSRRFVEIASVPEWTPLAIVGRFGRHDTYRLELQFIMPASGDQCGSSVQTREN